jgi:hypothetical protein
MMTYRSLARQRVTYNLYIALVYLVNYHECTQIIFSFLLTPLHTFHNSQPSLTPTTTQFSLLLTHICLPSQTFCCTSTPNPALTKEVSGQGKLRILKTRYTLRSDERGRHGTAQIYC